jgi:hypothetical protein
MPTLYKGDVKKSIGIKAVEIVSTNHFHKLISKTKGDSTMLRNLFTTLTIAFAAMLLTFSAHAQNFLEEEAGITAYTNVGRAINLSAVKNAFRTIEHETADYVIGSVAIPDYTESEDAHVYIHKDGWLAAYYLKDEPVAKIIDLAHYEGGQISGTKLDLALLGVANALGLPISDVSYYDFVAPQANQLLLVIDRENGRDATDSFDITIPSEITVFERSWGFYSTVPSRQPTFNLDGNEIIKLQSRTVNILYGKLTPNQLLQGITHRVNVNNGFEGWSAGGIALVYQQP